MLQQINQVYQGVVGLGRNAKKKNKNKRFSLFRASIMKNILQSKN
jgi:hypothetical protein